MNSLESEKLLCDKTKQTKMLDKFPILGKYKNNFYACKIIDKITDDTYLVEFIKSKYKCNLTKKELIFY